MDGKIDRAKVLRFFKWSNQEFAPLLIAIGCIIVANWIGYVGVVVAQSDEEKAWILGFTFTIAAGFLGVAALSFRKAMKGDKPLLEFHGEVKKAKNLDFANVLIQSFRKTDTALDKVLDFDPTGLVSHISDAAGSEDGQLLEALRPKAVFLAGRRDDTGFLKFLLSGGSLTVEYSPVSVAVLYLTRSELICYFASADIVRGEVSAEEIERVPLQNIAEVTMEPAIRRIGRTGNDRLFHEYDRVTRNNPSREIISVERSIRVATTDGQDLVLPAGDPVYHRGKSQNARVPGKETTSRAFSARSPAGSAKPSWLPEANCAQNCSAGSA